MMRNLVVLELVLSANWLVGCGVDAVSAAATRVLDVEPSVLQQAPVCFQPPPSNLGLTDRASALQVIGICEAAAKRQGTMVVSAAQGDCLVASLSFKSENTGMREAECQRGAFGVQCDSSGIFHKEVKVTLRREPNGKAVAETAAIVQSRVRGFSDKSYFALCSAAFHKYPGSLVNERFEAPVE